MITQNKHLDTAIIAIGVSFVAYILFRLARLLLKRYVAKAADELKMDATKQKFFNNALGFVFFIATIIIFFFIIPELRPIATSLFAGAGILAAIVGFASQAAFSNIISGIFIVIFRPFSVGDMVKFGTDNFGTVEDITLRHTVILGLENRRLIVPNTVISQEIIVNSSIKDEKTCIFIPLRVSFDCNIDKVIKAIQEEAQKHPSCIDNRTQEDIEQAVPQVIVRVIDFAESAINIRAQVWANDPASGFFMRCDLYKSIKERFDKDGIEIPFPHRSLIFKG